MQRLNHHRKRSGLTLVETMMYVALAVVLSYVTYSFLTGASLLYAKNMSIVHSHTNLRSVLDRTLNNMQQGNSLPVLIDTTGTVVTTPPSAGLYYDRYLGDPYVVTNPAGVGLPSGTTSVTITCSTVALASPPAPKVGDAIVIHNPSGDVRTQISGSVAGALDTVNQRQPYTVTLSTALAAAISWPSTEVRTATLVHREAFLVVQNGNQAELRFFQSFEPIPNAAGLANTANYSVISNQLSVLSGEMTPFSITTVGSDKIVKASFFARSTDFSTYLATKQAYEFNTFVRVNTSLSSRLRPQQ